MPSYYTSLDGLIGLLSFSVVVCHKAIGSFGLLQKNNNLVTDKNAASSTLKISFVCESIHDKAKQKLLTC